MLVKYVVIKDNLWKEGNNLHWTCRFPDYPKAGEFGGTVTLPITPAQLKVAIETAIIPFLQDYRTSLQYQANNASILDAEYEVDIDP